jgi:hypothetical protein
MRCAIYTCAIYMGHLCTISINSLWPTRWCV